ncbi:zinc knuckle domain-containing protein [Hirsutella rhossiliensis]
MNQSLLSNRYLFLDYLNRRYGDPNAKARALDRLRSLKQKPDESFASFFPKFEKELADSGGGEWADVVQINYLEGAINNRLKSSLVSAIASISTNDNKAASRGQERSMVVYPNRSSPDKAPSPGSPTTSSPPSDDQMDWEPVKANRLINGRRAPEEKQFVPLEERKCYECGKLGHLAAKCPEGAAAESQGARKG